MINEITSQIKQDLLDKGYDVHVECFIETEHEGEIFVEIFKKYTETDGTKMLEHIDCGIFDNETDINFIVNSMIDAVIPLLKTESLTK